MAENASFQGVVLTPQKEISSRVFKMTIFLNFFVAFMNHIAQCSKTVVTPLKNRGRTRAIEGYFFNENLRPKLQLDVIGY